MKLTVKRVLDHYELYIGSEFICSCDPAELRETIKEVEQNM